MNFLDTKLAVREILKWENDIKLMVKVLIKKLAAMFHSRTTDWASGQSKSKKATQTKSVPFEESLKSSEIVLFSTAIYLFFINTSRNLLHNKSFTTSLTALFSIYFVKSKFKNAPAIVAANFSQPSC